MIGRDYTLENPPADTSGILHHHPHYIARLTSRSTAHLAARKLHQADPSASSARKLLRSPYPETHAQSFLDGRFPASMPKY